MFAQALPWVVLFAGVALLAQACRGLAADARRGFEVSMGGAMLFNQVWLLGAAGCAWGGTALLGVPWWAGLIAFTVLFLLKIAVYRIIVALFLGRSLPAPAPNPGGFGAFVKRTETLDEQCDDDSARKNPDS